MAFTKTRSQISPTLVKTGTGSTSPAGGTDDLLTSGNPVKFQINQSKVRIRHHGNSFTKRKGIAAARFWDITLQFYLQGSGTAGDPAVNGYAAIDALLRAAGMTLTDGASDLAYAPSTIATLEKCEIHWDANGLLHTAQNCVGNIVMEGRPNDGIVCTWTGRGDYAEPTIGTISGFTGGTDRAEAFLGISGTVTPSGGSAYTPVVTDWRFDRGIQLAQIPDANSSTGIQENFIGDATPTMTLGIALDKDGASNLQYDEIYGDLTGNSSHSVTFAHGTTPNQITYLASQSELDDIRLSEGDRFYAGSLAYTLSNTTNESDFSFTIA